MGRTYIIDIMEDITPKGVKDCWRNQKPAYAHPQTVCKCGEGESDDEVGKERGHQHNE